MTAWRYICPAVYGAVGREDHLFAITLEHRLLLPDLQHLELGRMNFSSL
jgi:hypothetical protein